MDIETVGVAIIGCGLIGQKRAQALGSATLAVCCDTDPERAQALARRYPECAVETDWRAVLNRPDVDVVLVATTHDMLAEIAAGAAGAGKHVLIEKPGARRAAELEPVAAAARRTGVRVRVGFNHRYHRALRQARALYDAGTIGPILYIHGRYGHGGRPGYEQEWRAQPEKSGGGEMIDQGIHLIDLARWFLGDFANVRGAVPTLFWKMPVEDNAFLLLETAAHQVAFLHATWTEWKNTFRFEICGRDGKLEITGLGGSYGIERLACYRMLPEMGPPETTIWEYPMEDNSWQVEFQEFLEDIRLGRPPSHSLDDARALLQIVESVYQDAGRVDLLLTAAVSSA